MDGHVHRNEKDVVIQVNKQCIQKVVDDKPIDQIRSPDKQRIEYLASSAQLLRLHCSSPTIHSHPDTHSPAQLASIHFPFSSILIHALIY